MHDEQFELIVIGTGPAGEKAAVKAAYFGHRVAIIEKEERLGGAEINTGTLPSKTLKETALFFSGKFERGLYGVSKELEQETTIEDFFFRKNYVIESTAVHKEENLLNHGVEIYKGEASFKDKNTITVKGEKEYTLIGEYILIATGSYPFHPENIPFDQQRIHDSDTILTMKSIPKSICIVGAGVIGCEYVTIFATLGIEVFLINDKDQILPFVDQEVTKELVDQMLKAQVTIYFNTSLEKIMVPEKREEPLQIILKNGKTIKADIFLFAAGRSGHIKELHLDQIGVKVGKREIIEVDETYKTSVANIYAVGDVIGFPSLASTSMDQGRIAVAHMFQTKDLDHLSKYVPFGIYTVPEVSMVGITEEEAKKQSLGYVIGKAFMKDLSRGKIMGLKAGFLKLIIDRENQIILGVHVIGRRATELIHFGLMLVAEKKTLFHVINYVFNYPTLHDLYKHAAYDALGNIHPKIIRKSPRS